MLTKLKLALFVAAPLVAGGATYAVAHADSGGRAELIQKFDKNGDGKLDDAERADMKAAFAAKRAERKQEMLAKFDLNKDGVLDKSERAAMKDSILTERFQKMDANGDGTLSLAEFKAGAELDHRHARSGHGHHRAALQGTAPAVK